MRSSVGSLSWRRGAWSSVVLAVALYAAPARAQMPLRRAPAVQHVAAVAKGDFLLGLGVGYQRGQRFPLVDVHGNLTRLGVLELGYALGAGVLIRVRGDIHRILSVERIGTPLVEPDEGLADGRDSGSGRYSVATLFRLVGSAEGLSAGGHLEFTIPSDNESEAAGTNTTDLRISAQASYGRGRLRATADIGVGILEAPLENFEQNDVLVYGAEVVYRVSRATPARVYVGVDGRASTRSRVPVGTEDRGVVLVGLDYRLGRLLVDTGGLFGIVEDSPDWGLVAGVSWLGGPTLRRVRSGY